MKPASKHSAGLLDCSLIVEMKRPLFLLALLLLFEMIFVTPSFATFNKKVSLEGRLVRDSSCDNESKLAVIATNDGHRYCVSNGDSDALESHVGSVVKIKGEAILKDDKRNAHFNMTSDYIVIKKIDSGNVQICPSCNNGLGSPANADVSASPGTQAASDEAQSIPVEGPPDNTPIQTPQSPTQSTVSQGSKYVQGVPQCTRTQYENQDAKLWIANSCNIAVTVEFTSDSGNTWGQADVGPSDRTEVRAFGIGYSPRKDGTVYLFTCPKSSQPVLPNGSPFLARNYRGQFTCADQ